VYNSNDMLGNTEQIPVPLRAALQRGDIIQAIRLLREATGLGLKDAKDVIDQQLHGNPTPLQLALRRTPVVPSSKALSETVSTALQSGNKVEAIRLLRQHSGMGLKEAKEMIETSPHNTYMTNANLSPGKVAGSGGFAGWLIVAIIISAAVFFFLNASG
jgi:ribosomal protein L7/L12